MRIALPISQKARVALFTALIALPLVLSGCVSTSVSREYPDGADISYRGGTIDPVLWEVAGNVEEDALPYRSYNFSWLLPTTLRNRAVFFDGPNQVNTRSVAYNGLGIPLLLLPVRFHYSESFYTNGATEEPTATQWATWNPFWTANSGENLSDDHARVRTRGVPLFFGRVDMTSPDTQVGLWSTLWSLGPAFFTYNGEIQYEANEPPAEMRATAGMPLALGGILGAVLWTDVEMRQRHGEDHLRWSSHGPFFGSLGYVNVNARSTELGPTEENGTPEPVVQYTSTKSLLTGLLWLDLINKEVGNRASHFEARGPLWSAFGWGKRGGRNTVRVFWVPIVLPGQGSSQ